jgi:hypothetical protein
MPGRAGLLLVFAAVTAAADSPLLTLRQGGEVSCRPAEPFFCENVHVRCAGRTAAQTFPFTLRAAAGSPALVTEAPDFRRRYEDADVEWDRDGTYVLLQPKGAPGYVKLLADGKYVFRHYLRGLGVMSLGRCR